MRANDDGKTVAAMDVLVPGIGELIGGSQREERLDVLKKKCADFNIPEDHVWWYLETRKFGSAKHCGFGMGFERLVMYVTGMSNIRDVIPSHEPHSSRVLKIKYAKTVTTAEATSEIIASANSADETLAGAYCRT